MSICAICLPNSKCCFFSQEVIMKPNVGGVDLNIRIVLGIVLLVVGLVAPVSAMWQIVALVVAAIALITAVVRFCPANYLLRINTCKLEEKK
jgi:hypothetical protein